MSNLEDFIRENRGAFDSEEPTPGHLQRFENKINTRKESSPIAQFWWAAAVVAGILIAIQIHEKDCGLGVLDDDELISLHGSDPKFVRVDTP